MLTITGIINFLLGGLGSVFRAGINYLRGINTSYKHMAVSFLVSGLLAWVTVPFAQIAITRYGLPEDFVFIFCVWVGSFSHVITGALDKYFPVWLDKQGKKITK